MLSFCGIDVSKDRLDGWCCPTSTPLRCRTTQPAGRYWSSSCAASRSQRSASRLAAATSVVPCARCKQLACQFAKASGVLAKNDPLDARMIASFVGIMPTRPAQPATPAAEQLVEMLAVRRQLSAEKTAAENASRLLEDLMLQRLSRRRIARLAADIELLDKRLVEIVATDATLAHRYRLLTSMPGVGPVLACTLIALLPELGGMSRKQVAALVGVAPYAFESGTLKGRRCIWGGRANVRQVLYMAAMSASNWNPALKLFHDRLKRAGKLPKVVIVAVMRKMITTLNAMVRDDIAWADRLSGRHRVTTAR